MTVRRRPLSSRSLLQSREVESRDRVLDQLRWSSRSSHLAASTLLRSPRARARRPRRGSARARASSRASICFARLLEPALAVRLGLAPSHRCTSASATLRASARIAPRLALGLGRSAAGAPRAALRASSRACVGLLDRRADADRGARRSSSGSGRTRSCCRTKSVIAKQTSVQIIRPGRRRSAVRLRAASGASPSSLRPGRRRAGRRSGRRRRRPR